MCLSISSGNGVFNKAMVLLTKVFTTKREGAGECQRRSCMNSGRQ